MTTPNKHILTLGNCSECCFVLADTEEADCGNTWHSPTWSLSCPGVEEGGCRTWWECTLCPKACDYDSLDDGDPVAHGQEHQWFNGAWMVPGGTCWLREGGGFDEAVRTEADWYREGLPNLEPGRYTFDWSGEENYIEITNLRPIEGKA